MTIQVWNSKTNTAAQALELPEGRLVADVGFLVETSDNTPDNILEAAEAIIAAGLNVTVASGAKLTAVAQQKGVAFTDWAGKLSA